MSIKILKLNKNLSLIDSISTDLSDSMSIDHFNDVVKNSNAEIIFTISATDSQIPFIDEEEFCIVIREKVDLSAQGPNDVIIKNINKDVGNKSYKDFKPYSPVELPPGFIELKGKE